MNIKKNQISLCSIKILQAFTNKLLYQTLNIYKTKYLHFSTLAIVKIFKINIFCMLLYQNLIQNTNFEKNWKKELELVYPPYKLIHPKKSKKTKGRKIGVSKRLKKRGGKKGQKSFF